MIFEVIKTGVIKLLAERLSYEEALSSEFAEKWRFKRLVKRVEVLEKEAGIEPPKSSRFDLDD